MMRWIRPNRQLEQVLTGETSFQMPNQSKGTQPKSSHGYTSVWANMQCKLVYHLRRMQTAVLLQLLTVLTNMWFHHPVIDSPYSIQRHVTIQVNGSSHRFKYITKCLWYLNIFFTIFIQTLHLEMATNSIKVLIFDINFGHDPRRNKNATAS